MFFLWLVYYVYINNITTPQTEHNDVYIKKNINTTPNIYPVVVGLNIFLVFIINYIYIQNFNTNVVF